MQASLYSSSVHSACKHVLHEGRLVASPSPRTCRQALPRCLQAGKVSCATTSTALSASSQQEPTGVREVCLGRRGTLAAGLASVAATIQLVPAAVADTTATTAPISEAGEDFEDDEYRLFAPGGYNYIEIALPRKEIGPAPERSPLRVRFDAQEGGASLTVVVKAANQLKTTFTQVGDITAFGEPEQAANYLLPKRAVLYKFSKEVVPLKPRITKLGEVPVPPRTYYRYEFDSPTGEHVYMSAAAARGKVFVCGGSAEKAKWPQPSIGQALVNSVESFRLKEATPPAV